MKIRPLRKIKRSVIVFFFLITFFSLALPRQSGVYLQEKTLNLFFPLWKLRSYCVNSLFSILDKRADQLFLQGSELKLKDELQRLYLENYLLKQKLEDHFSTPFLQARVIFRSPFSWNQSLWIDIGFKDNLDPKHPIIEKNSPVVMGCCLVGVVEEVCANKSLVKLITDHSVTPSVVALRDPDSSYLKTSVERVIQGVESLDDSFSSDQNYHDFIQSLWEFKSFLEKKKGSSSFSTGLLRGAKHSLFAKNSTTLIGEGFDLTQEKEPFSLSLKEGDLLITSGLDGVFPKGLEVGFIEKVYPLKEGAFSYSLEAKPVIEDFNQLYHLSVLPAMIH